jgi:putative flippase GtrA
VNMMEKFEDVFGGDERKKWLRYGAVSAIAIAVSFSTFTACYRFFGMGEVVSQTIAVLVSTIPAYVLSRRWIWSLGGSGSVKAEIIPFWVLSLLQFLVSLAVVAVAGNFIRPRVDSHDVRTALLLLVNLGTYGSMWVAKFFFLNRILFADKAVASVSA